MNKSTNEGKIQSFIVARGSCAVADCNSGKQFSVTELKTGRKLWPKILLKRSCYLIPGGDSAKTFFFPPPIHFQIQFHTSAHEESSLLVYDTV